MTQFVSSRSRRNRPFWESASKPLGAVERCFSFLGNGKSTAVESTASRVCLALRIKHAQLLLRHRLRLPHPQSTPTTPSTLQSPSKAVLGNENPLILKPPGPEGTTRTIRILIKPAINCWASMPSITSAVSKIAKRTHSPSIFGRVVNNRSSFPRLPPCWKSLTKQTEFYLQIRNRADRSCLAQQLQAPPSKDSFVGLTKPDNASRSKREIRHFLVGRDPQITPTVALFFQTNFANIVSLATMRSVASLIGSYCWLSRLFAASRRAWREPQSKPMRLI